MNFIQIGYAYNFVAMIMAGFLLGYLTDYFFGTIPLFLIIFGIMGFIGGLIKMKESLVDNAPDIKKVKEK
jgi:ATP synthase protein I